MRAKYRFVLNKEVLTSLADEELESVHGAAVPTLPAGRCVANQASEVIECTSIFVPCVTSTC